MDLLWYQYLMLIIGGMLAGMINTLAGNGSTITLFLLMSIGLPATIANGTNRIGILFQSIFAVGTFRQAEQFKPLITNSWWVVALTLIGSICGAITASSLDPTLLKNIIGWLMLAMLIVILVNPKRWLRATDTTKNRKTILNVLLFLALGFYAGFIQMGMGIIFLAVMVLGAKYSLVDANIIKLVVVLVLTVPVLCIFIYQNQVNWLLGFTLAIGQSFGAWLAAKFALKNEKANVWIHRLLVIVVSFAALRLLGVFEYLIQFFE